MYNFYKIFLGSLMLLSFSIFSTVLAQGYDLVINNGRVIDPESGLDEVRHIGVINGRIVTISNSALVGAREIDAGSLVVSPGFVDIHAHGQTEEAYRLMVQDGVTSGFELEIGTAHVGEWYAERSGGQVLNYGISIGHIKIQIIICIVIRNGILLKIEVSCIEIDSLGASVATDQVVL